METLVLHNDHNAVTALWFSFFIVCSYWYGTIKFDHENITKAYDVLDELIKRDIKSLRRALVGENYKD